MTESLAKMTDVIAGYDGVEILHGVTLNIEPGEVVALLGPNGAGKTTTILTMLGFLPASSGTVEVLGAPVASTSRLARRGVAFVPEERALFFDLTVKDNLLLAVRGPRRARAAAFEEAVDLFPALGPLLRRQAGLLSGGEQQMLAMARAFVTHPKLLVIDELTLGLAPVIVERIFPILKRFVADEQVGTLLVEQHVKLALEFADRGIVLNGGQIIARGAAAELAADRSLLEISYLGAG